ncbi:FAD-binding oxidoreductase [Paludisphaera rhizosphaerae]|uniref:FAD-binding oxidoreductase n=1 Tax=Paludisphaera rhizosphaerae TaxID=2711216 RepID=UPI0013EA414C|nr:FAD-binding oxidoreductase [Paludisphaera rhizosphaerae]
MTRSTWPDSPDLPPLGDGRRALAVHQPHSVEDLCEVVRSEAEAGGAVYPQGGRTALDYGGTPARPGVAVDLTALKQVVDYPHADMTITVQGGLNVASLQSVLAEHHQRLLFDVPTADRATIGGALATGVFGPRRYGQGRPRDSIIGVSFVTSKGVEVKGGGRVVKNVAGYDFPKLLTGSLGTLGVITQATLKVRPKPGGSALIWLPVDEPTTLDANLASLDASSTRPVAVEFLNPSAAAIIGDALGLKGGSWTFVLGIEDDAASVDWQVEHFLSGKTSGVDVLRNDETPPLWSALTDFQAGPALLACTANLRPSRVAGFMAALDPERWAVQAHAGSGVVRMRARGDWNEDQAVEAVSAARAQAVRDSGALVVTCCPTAWKPRLRVWGDPRPDWALGKAVKQALDPIGLMNPGRFVGEA